MLIAVFHSEGIVRKTFVPEEQKVNAAFYLLILDRLCKSMQRIRPKLWKIDRCFCCTTMRWVILRVLSSFFLFFVLTNKRVFVISHLTFSSDSSSPNYLLSPKLKLELKRDHYCITFGIQTSVMNKLKSISKKFCKP